MAPSRGGKGSAKGSKGAKKPSTTTQKKQIVHAEQTTSSTSHSTISSIPLEVQQSLLNVFSSAFPDLLNAQAAQNSLRPLLQEIKGHLYSRDFAAAFGRGEYLEAYAARWSASRALGYLDIFYEVLQHFEGVEHEILGEAKAADKQQGKQSRAHARKASSDVEVICLGGGAGAELIALAGLLRLYEFQPDPGRPNVVDTAAEETMRPADTENQTCSHYFAATLVDIANWSNVTAALSKAIFDQPKVSPYASAAVKAAATPLVSSTAAFSSRFVQQDVLEPEYDISDLMTSKRSATVTDPLDQRVLSPGKNLLITIMFTLNELYAASIAATQHLLIKLTSAAPPGTLLLIVDSPGSYSTVTVNNSEKKYPMLWLLEHTLLMQAPKALDPGKNEDHEAVVWRRILSDESRWFRLPEVLRYPIELENMRYQMHLYRRM